MPRYDSFESTFSLIMMSLELQEIRKHKLVLKRPPYSFTASRALESMADINYKIYYGENFTDINITMSPESALPLLQRYLNSHLIHCPTERGLTEILPRSLLQPTAKGIAIMEEFCVAFSLKHPYNKTLFKSPLNTMTLLQIPHDHVTTHVQVSESVLMMIWLCMLGKKPNSYSHKSKKDSPYWHRWLLHPHGNSISQYYNSDGIRLFNNVSFRTPSGKRGYKMDYILSGRGIYQWLMDCTNIMHPGDAEIIAKMYVSREYLRKMTDVLCDEITAPDNFPPEISRTTLYRIAHRGHLMCRWSEDLLLDFDLKNADHWTTITECDFPPVKTLKHIYNDPGLVMVFNHTMQRLFADENMRFLTDFEEVCERYEFAINDSSCKMPAMTTWQHLVGIVYRYITVNSPFEINIPPEMRKLIVEEIPEGRITYNEMQVRVDVLMRRIELAKEHIEELVEAMISHFISDPIFRFLPLMAKAVNPPPKKEMIIYEKFDRSKLYKRPVVVDNDDEQDNEKDTEKEKNTEVNVEANEETVE